MTKNVNIPETVQKAFPQLTAATFVRQFAAAVPLVPDTTFDIFMTKKKQSFALVATDYVDPLAQSQGLKVISGPHEFEFDHLLKPYDNDQVIENFEHDVMDRDFFVSIENTNFYVAGLKSGK